MTLNDLLPLLGHSELNADLERLLRSAGASVQSLSAGTLRREGSDAIELVSLGLELAFWEREAYERKVAAPKDAGTAILVAVFAYGPGGKRFKPYAGPIPYGNGPIAGRQDALSAFGAADATEEDDGVVEWDQWIKDGLQLRTTYREDSPLWNLSFSVPFK